MPGFVFLSRQVALLDVKIIEFFHGNVLPVLKFSATGKLAWDVASSLPFSLEGERKRFLFYNQSFFVISPIKSIPSLKFSQDHSRSTLGITCGRGLFAVHFGDHLRSRDHLRLGIICGTILHSKLPPTISFAIACTFSDNLSRNSCIFTGLSLRAGGRGFPPAIMSVAPGYFYWKIKEK